MNRVDDYLMDKESKLLLSIHDELIIEVKYGEEFVIEKVKEIMETIYPFNRLPLLVDVEIAKNNMAEKEAYVV
jgi:DNA polymerase I-like protein with 3'-5' exonuclease and polymerase domains